MKIVEKALGGLVSGLKGRWNLNPDGSVNHGRRLQAEWDLTGRGDYVLALWIGNPDRWCAVLDILGRGNPLHQARPCCLTEDIGLILQYRRLLVHLMRG